MRQYRIYSKWKSFKFEDSVYVAPSLYSMLLHKTNHKKRKTQTTKHSSTYLLTNPCLSSTGTFPSNLNVLPQPVLCNNVFTVSSVLVKLLTITTFSTGEEVRRCWSRQASTYKYT